VPTGVTNYNPIDMDNSGNVDSADLGRFLTQFGTYGPGDFSGNGIVDSEDLGVMLGAL